MKHLKKIGLFILLSLFLCSCGGKELDTPENLNIRDGYLHWDAVSEAESYEIYINGTKYTSTENKIQLPEMKKEDKIYVVAIAENAKSENSSELSYDSKTVSLLENVLEYVDGFMPSSNKVFYGQIKLPEKFYSTAVELLYKSNNTDAISIIAKRTITLIIFTIKILTLHILI